MSYTVKSKPLPVQASAYTLVPKETLHMLGAVLKTAFRMHCTGETVCSKNPWQLVHEVQEKLTALSPELESVVSEQRLVRYIEDSLSRPGFLTERTDPLVEAN
jgi:hypothetical protein